MRGGQEDKFMGVAIIEVAIGLIFVFSVMSILVTQINTVIINFLNLKAKRLKEQLDKMLTDPVIRAKIMTHPLIGMVEADATKQVILTNPDEHLSSQAAVGLTENKRAKVSYIQPETFVAVLVDVLTANTGQKLYEELNKAIEALPPSIEKSKFRELLRQIRLSGTGLNELRDLIEQLADVDNQRAMLTALNLVDAALDKLQAESSDLIPILLGIRQIKDNYLQTALEAVLNTATSLKDAQVKLGQWFNNTMERASERYIREMQRFSLGIGLALAIILNVDTLYLARTLWEDPALRGAVAVTAEANAPRLEEQANQADPTQPDGDLEQSIYEAQDILRQLLDLRLPIGWTYEAKDNATASTDIIVLDSGRSDARNLWMLWPGNNPDWLGLWIKKIIGIVVTMIAVAQGAPFWFDLLRKLTRGGSG
jgi:hypothetical protein